MASKKARELRREYKKAGFLVVESTHRVFKKGFGQPKAEIEIPEGATTKTHPFFFTARVQQREAFKTQFKVVRENNKGLTTIHRKEGSGLKLCRTYWWSGRKLWLLTPKKYMQKMGNVRPSKDFLRQDLPSLTHEQCVDIENALIRL